MRYARLLVTALAVILFAMHLSAFGANDQLVYDDRLSNDWANWSWAQTDLNATSPVHSGSTSIQVTYSLPYQGFYLRAPAAVNTSLYTSFVFWINGGSFSGRTINVHAILNSDPGDSPSPDDDQSQPAVSLNSFIQGGSIQAGTWLKVTIPLSALGAAGDPSSPLIGIILQEGAGTAEPPFYIDDISLAGASVPAEVNVSVDVSQVVRTVDPRSFGLNTAVWDSNLGGQATTTMLGAAGTAFLRFPGGSTSDEYHWQTSSSGATHWSIDTDKFAAVASALNAQAIITANYGTGTADEAAGWVRYANVTKHYGFKYWEIGNENYGPWETDIHASAHDPYTYANEAKDYIAAMKAVDPSIKIGVVIDKGEDSWVSNMDHPATNPRTGEVHNGWTPVLLATLKSLGVTPDFVVYHRYDQNPGNEGDVRLLQSSASWKVDAAAIRQMLDDYLGKTTSAQVEILCTEHNSVSSSPGKQSTSLVNGLFEADSLGQLLQTEFDSLVWWDLRNSQDSGNNNSPSLYGWRGYGDYGLVTPTAASNPYPTYYVLKLLTHFAAGGDKVVEASSDFGLLSAYASLRADGSLSVLVINKSPDSPLGASLTINGYSPVGSAAVYSYGIAQDDAARKGSGSPDVAFTSASGASAAFTYTFAPYSATVLSFRNSTAAVGPVIAAVQYDGKKHLSIQGSGFGASAHVTINGADISAYIKSDTDSLIKIKAKQKLLGLQPGNNTIQVIDANGHASAVYNLSL